MKTNPMTDALYDYVAAHTPDPSPVLARLRDETKKLPHGGMQIAPDQGAFMHMMVKLCGAKRVLELGCFTGYSAICMASALPEDGRLVTLDIDPEITGIARRYFEEAGLARRIELRIGPALDSLAKLRQEYGPGGFDVMFIDADKANIDRYYEAGLDLVRRGGVIMVDNVLWSGKVAAPGAATEDTLAIRAFNTKAAKDERVDRVLLHISDGIFVLRKR